VASSNQVSAAALEWAVQGLGRKARQKANSRKEAPDKANGRPTGATNSPLTDGPGGCDERPTSPPHRTEVHAPNGRQVIADTDRHWTIKNKARTYLSHFSCPLGPAIHLLFAFAQVAQALGPFRTLPAVTGETDLDSMFATGTPHTNLLYRTGLPGCEAAQMSQCGWAGTVISRRCAGVLYLLSKLIVMMMMMLMMM
jgi:hypothetical protein